MEPQLPKPRLPNPEQLNKTNPDEGSLGLEQGVLQKSIERNLVNPEVDRVGSGQQSAVQPPVDDTSQQVTAQVSQTPPSSQLNDDATSNPIVASDDDVIEKDWVDKAKQIVKETSNDPRMQKYGVSVLQADYLSKRYGKNIRVPDDK